MIRVQRGIRAGVSAVCLPAVIAVAAGPSPGTTASGVPVGGAQLVGQGVIVNHPARGWRPLPHVAASAYLVADAGTGQVLAAKDPHGWYLPASTLKILTAIALMPVLNPDQMVVASRRAADVTPSRVGLIAGNSYRVSDLFKALLLVSANDAAIALAQATGSFAKGVAMMNSEARHLRANDTVAVRPNGLDAWAQHSSAYDLALFARQALAIPAFMQDESLWVSTFPRRPGHRPVKLWNQNLMLETYRGDLGGKIGWTTAAKTTFVGWARRNGNILIVTIMHYRPLTEMTYAARLLNWGFAMDGKVKPVGDLVRRPLARAAVTHHLLPARRPAAQPAAPALPGVPLAAGLGTLALAVLTVAAIQVARRSQRAGNRPGP